MKTPRTTTAETAPTTACTDEGNTMKTNRTEMTIEMVQQLKGEELLQAHEQVLGAAAKPKTPVPVLRARIIAALEKRAAEPAEAEASTTSENALEAAPAVGTTPPAEVAPEPALVAPQDAPADAPATTTADDDEEATSGNDDATGAPANADAATDDTAAAATTATPATDRALPAIGTKIVKRDRKGNIRAACEVVEGGVLFAGTIYKSLSAAALAAARSLGLVTKTLNGWAWWNIADQPRPVRTTAAKPVDFDALAKSWQRYLERVEAVVKTAGAEDRARLQQVLAAHASAHLSLTSAAAEAAAPAEAA